MIRLLLVPALLALTAASLPGRGEPAITPQTARSGGPIDPDQAKLTFDAADLRFEVLPETETLNGTAILSFTAKAPLDRLVIDLDHNLGPHMVAIDGVQLAPSAYRNPEGRLIIALPHSVAAGGHVTATIGFGGTMSAEETSAMSTGGGAIGAIDGAGRAAGSGDTAAAGTVSTLL